MTYSYRYSNWRDEVNRLGEWQRKEYSALVDEIVKAIEDETLKERIGARKEFIHSNYGLKGSLPQGPRDICEYRPCPDLKTGEDKMLQKRGDKGG